MIRFLLRSVLCLLIFQSVAVAGGPYAQNELSAYLDGLQTMTARFVQRQKDHGVFVTTKGRLALRRPGQFKWQVESPTKQWVIIDGGVMWIYDPELQQAMKQPFEGGVQSKDKEGQAMPASPIALLLYGSHERLAQFHVSYATIVGQEKNACFALHAKDKQAPVQWMQICFNSQGAPVNLMVHAVAQSIHWRFENIRLNQSMSEHYFKFVPPKGTDVI